MLRRQQFPPCPFLSKDNVSILCWDKGWKESFNQQLESVRMELGDVRCQTKAPPADRTPERQWDETSMAEQEVQGDCFSNAFAGLVEIVSEVVGMRRPETTDSICDFEVSKFDSTRGCAFGPQVVN
jgi:hypothetical protein